MSAEEEILGKCIANASFGPLLISPRISLGLSKVSIWITVEDTLS